MNQTHPPKHTAHTAATYEAMDGTIRLWSDRVATLKAERRKLDYEIECAEREVAKGLVTDQAGETYRPHSYGLVRVHTPSSGLGIYVYPCGIMYADRSKFKWGDYVRIAFLDYATLTFKPEADADKTLLAVAQHDAAGIQSRKGSRFDISATGQYVILGDAL